MGKTEIYSQLESFRIDNVWREEDDEYAALENPAKNMN